MSWTEQQIQELKKMWGNGFSASAIAKQLGGGLTRNAVIGKAHRLKLSVGAASVKSEHNRVGPGSEHESMVNITRISTKKRAMLPPLPVVRAPVVVKPSPQTVVKEALRSIETIKKPEGIAVTKAGERHCRWPIGDPRSPDFRFCGCDCYEGLPYCLDHARVAYQTISKRGRGGDTESVPEFKLSGRVKKQMH